MTLASYPQGIGKQRTGRTRIATVQAPVGGWNTRDALDQMDPRDAVVLDNWIPGIGKVASRGGYADFAADIAGDIGGSWVADDVETLFNLVHGTNEKFLAAMDGGIARIDTGTAAQLKVRGSYTSDRWQWTTFTDSTAPNTPQIYAVNGADQPWKYDGSTFANWSPTVTGATLTDFVWITSFKNRIYMGEKDSRNFWVSSAVGDDTAFTRFPLSGIRGAQGNILFMAAMTRDTGSGPDDFAVFVTTEGQAIVYAGNDPTTATAWALVGVYQIPRPINSHRSWIQLFGDVIIATELDYIFLADALQSSGGVVVNPSKLTGAMTSAAAAYKDNYGWQLIASEKDGIILSNIPLNTNGTYQQHVINVQTRAPSRFTGWNFSAFGVFNGNLYGAANNAVYRLLNGGSDDSSGAETPIKLRAQTAWTNFGSSEFKHVRAIRPLFRTQGAFKFGAGIGVGFVDPSVVTVASAGPAGASTLWGDTSGVTTLWGDASGAATFWSGTVTASPASSREWRLEQGRGGDFSTVIQSDVTDQIVEWLQTQYKVELTKGF